MSDSILRIIPSDPAFVPDVDAQQCAAALVREAFPEADDVGLRTADDVAFVDAGANFDSVFCPKCANELAQDWWADAMDQAAAGRFVDLAVKLPCCGKTTTLNDLRYEMPQGFARFVVDVMNPTATSVPAGLEARLRETLSCELRFIWAHY
jgi:hypothetical protein